MSRSARRFQFANDTSSPGGSGPNLLVGKVFTADVGDSTSEPGNPVANLTDQQVNTRWISQSTSPVNLTADLGGVYDLSRLVIVFAGNTIRNYTVSVSTNGSAYTQIASGTTNNTTPQTVAIASFSATAKGRYLRITGCGGYQFSQHQPRGRHQLYLYADGEFYGRRHHQHGQRQQTNHRRQSCKSHAARRFYH